MGDTLKWKAEVQFTGTVEQFNQFAEMLEKARVEVTIPEWHGIPHHLAGCFPFPIDNILTREQLKKIIDKQVTAQIKYIRDIRGGIRTPHLHLDEQIVMLDRERFKDMVKNVAERLAVMRVERLDDYLDVMKVVNDIGRFDPTPQPA
jgi:hypothetical protein